MERLDLRLVGYFVAVAEELHFGRAAERLHIAQPSLSQQIRRLESQLGLPLFERNSRHVHLTAAGRAFLSEGRATLAQAKRAIEAARSAGAPRVTVGFYGSAASELLPTVLHEFRERHPDHGLAVRELLFGSLKDIIEGQVDCAFTRLMPGQADLEIEVLGQEPRLVALPRTHPLARRRSVRFLELREERFVINPMTPHERPPARWLAEQRQHALPGQVAAQASSVQEILALVAARSGVCLVPRTVARHHPRADVAYVPIVDADPAVISLAWQPTMTSPALERFIRVSRAAAARADTSSPATAMR